VSGDVIDMIDNAIHQHFGDAMRWAPEPDTGLRLTGPTATLLLAPDEDPSMWNVQLRGAGADPEVWHVHSRDLWRRIGSVLANIEIDAALAERVRATIRRRRRLSRMRTMYHRRSR
jgi:hypothetical protein